MKRSEIEQPSVQLEHSSPWKECPACQEALAQLTLDHMKAPKLPDDVALDRITEKLSEAYCYADTMDDVFQIIRQTGRTITAEKGK